MKVHRAKLNTSYPIDNDGVSHTLCSFFLIRILANSKRKAYDVLVEVWLISYFNKHYVKNIHRWCKFNWWVLVTCKYYIKKILWQMKRRHVTYEAFGFGTMDEKGIDISWYPSALKGFKPYLDNPYTNPDISYPYHIRIWIAKVGFLIHIWHRYQYPLHLTLFEFDSES